MWVLPNFFFLTHTILPSGIIRLQVLFKFQITQENEELLCIIHMEWTSTLLINQNFAEVWKFPTDINFIILKMLNKPARPVSFLSYYLQQLAVSKRLILSNYLWILHLYIHNFKSHWWILNSCKVLNEDIKLERQFWFHNILQKLRKKLYLVHKALTISRVWGRFLYTPAEVNTR